MNWRKPCASALALVLALAAGEGLARVGESLRASTQSVPMAVTAGEWAARYVLDPEFGFRPILGTDAYAEHGAMPNDYPLEKSPKRERVLFVGDSVTRRGRIVAALRAIYGEDDHEYWNAGVESFSLVQSVHYLLRFAGACGPDHLVLTFHYNDFQTTPVTFLDQDGTPVLYAPPLPTGDVVPWLYERSSLYRRLVKTWFAGEGERRIRAEMRDALATLRDWCEQRGARLSVVFHPYLEPEELWLDLHHRAHDEALAMCAEVGIRAFDLLPELRAAQAEGTPAMESPGDHEHPSDELAARFARSLAEAGLLEREGERVAGEVDLEGDRVDRDPRMMGGDADQAGIAR
jgi:hypothetical protein